MHAETKSLPTITAAPDISGTRARGGTVGSRTETSYKSPPIDRSATMSVAEGYLPTSKRLPTMRCTVHHGYDSSAGGKTCQGQPRCCVDNKLCFSFFYLKKVGTTLHVIFFLLPVGRKTKFLHPRQATRATYSNRAGPLASFSH